MHAIYMNENDQIPATSINIAESHKNNVKKEKSNKKVYILYYFIFINLYKIR